MTGTPAEPKVRLGIDLGGTKIAGVALGPDGTVHGRAPHRGPAARLCRHARAPSARWSRRLEQAAGARGSDRHRHAGLDLARERARAERQLHVAQRPAVRPRSRGPPGPPGAPRQRRQLLCPVGGGRWRGGRRASVFGVILGTGCGGGLVFDGRAHRRAARHRRRMGPQPAAVGDGGRASRARAAGAAATAAWRRGCRAPAWRPIMRGSPGTQLASEEIAARAGRGDAQRPSKPRSPRRAASPAGSRTWSTSSIPHVIVLGGGLSQLAASLRGAAGPDRAARLRRARAASRSSRRAGAMPAACAARPGCGSRS